MSRVQVLALYKSLIKESQKFDSYNYRNYALRKIRDCFRENMNLTDNAKIKEEILGGQKNLEIIRRQVFVGNLYKTDKLVIEMMK
ncbi:hypothetical protein PPYR_02522 [Photinus pyralis]|uniref:Complex 1 LYR protein domain-containing protein n=1 Tax=Photinus pyralis TaxID=7054 RepID=A0A5N4B7G8_PHOPY|nr:LYR motif-containing protein 4-like [Photinus pyralis]XP_031347096.1 LYR motif-containing protein 4-like [Photinus pyralis]KAB0805552.1 hypothetical protein PPYR_02522 [Photinus pyralis]